jgi:hypothetical protein
MRKTIIAGVVLAIVGWTGSSWAWDPDEVEKLEPKVAEVVAKLLEKDPGMQSFFDKAAGYAVRTASLSFSKMTWHWGISNAATTNWVRRSRQLR